MAFGLAAAWELHLLLMWCDFGLANGELVIPLNADWRLKRRCSWSEVRTFIGVNEEKIRSIGVGTATEVLMIGFGWTACNKEMLCMGAIMIGETVNWFGTGADSLSSSDALLDAISLMQRYRRQSNPCWRCDFKWYDFLDRRWRDWRLDDFEWRSNFHQSDFLNGQQRNRNFSDL